MSARQQFAKMVGDAKVYSYIRFSNIKQADGNSVERQQDYAEAWAKRNGLKLDETLSMRDEGLSAYHQAHVKKGALGLFLKAIETGKVPPGSVLVVEDLDRLSRASPLEAQHQMQTIILAGVTVVTAKDDMVYSRESLAENPIGLVMSLLKYMRSNDESKTKSNRVRDALRSACQGWVAGTYRGMISVGGTPSWLELVGRELAGSRRVGGKWLLIEERATALLMAIELYKQGKGTPRISAELMARGMSPTGIPITAGHLGRMFAHPALYGMKRVELDGEVFELEGYYPALLTRPEWDDLQELTKTRGRKHVRGTLPSLLTGIGVARCGYCNTSMIAQNMASAPTDKGGRIRDCNRRLHCVASKSGLCSVAGSCSSVPVEKALMNYCSDMINLQALYGGDVSALQRRSVAALAAKLAAVTLKADRLVEVIADSTGDSTALTKGLRKLEDEQASLQGELKQAEAELASMQRANIVDAHVRWAELVEGVDALDYDARLQARQLVADTFETIVVYHRGSRHTGTHPKRWIDIELRAKGGSVTRILSIDPKTGAWTEIDDVVETPLQA